MAVELKRSGGLEYILGVELRVLEKLYRTIVPFIEMGRT
jgi:hypothetical protein